MKNIEIQKVDGMSVIKKAFISVDKITEQELIDGAKIELTTNYQNKTDVETIDKNSNDLVDILIWDSNENKLVPAKTPRIVLFGAFYDSEIGEKYEMNKIIVTPSFEDNVLSVHPKLKNRRNGEIVYNSILENFHYTLNIIIGRLKHTEINLTIEDGKPLTQEQIDLCSINGLEISNVDNKDNQLNNIKILTNFDISLKIIPNQEVIWDDTLGFESGNLTILK